MKELSNNVADTSSNNAMNLQNKNNIVIDTGYVDTVSFILDNICWITGKSKRDHIFVNGKWILKPSLLTEEMMNRILSVNFEEKTKPIEGDNGKIIKQIYFVNDHIPQCTFYHNPMRHYTTITIQHYLLLGKSHIEIIEYIKDIYKYYFLIPQKYVDRLDKYLILGRIDYKRDFRYRDEQELTLMKELIELAPDYIVGKSYMKLDERDEHPEWDNYDDYEYMKKYRSKSNETVEFVIYDKQLEQEDKFRKGEITQNELDKFEKIIRFEVRIKDKKLNNIKSDLGISKELYNYKDENMADNFFSTYAEVAFFKEPFYRIDSAIEIIEKSKEKTKIKEKLISLVKQINKNGFTYTQQHYNFNDNTFRNHIKKLRSLEINPLTFSKKWTDKLGKIHETTYQTIPNFIKKENCIKEDENMSVSSKFKEVMK